MTDKILAGLLGVCVGDALGVPVEFCSRDSLAHAPVAEMRGYGTWNQPPGTWSDDSSLTLCLAECLCDGFDLQAIARSFCRWYAEGHWTAWGEAFDVGNTTAKAIHRLQKGFAPTESGGTQERDNGNGSLMRILPMAFWGARLDFPTLLDRVHQVSAITHAHPRAKMACGIYISVALSLLQGNTVLEAYHLGTTNARAFYTQDNRFAMELSHFDRLLGGDLAAEPESAIASDGYVVHTLEAALWCLLNSDAYDETVLRAVNLGGDTDTTAAVAGGLAGIYFGESAIPGNWVNAIARKDDIVALSRRLSVALGAEGNF